MINILNISNTIYQGLHMNNVPASNPLAQYFRQVKLYIPIPSKSLYYKDGVVELSENGELGILPMTGKDELALKNPDALFNGESLIEVLKSCAPGVKNARALLTNDMDAIITAIRYATYNDTLETQINCPKCSHENNYKLDLQYALDNMTYLEREYFVNINDLTIFIQPYTFPDVLKAMHAHLEQSKLVRSLSNDAIDEKVRAEIFSKAFKELSVTKFDLLCSSVVRIVNESNNINVVDKSFIKDYLLNIDKKSVDKISDLVDEVNKVGISRTFSAVCAKCNHKWDSDIDFNPVNFS